MTFTTTPNPHQYTLREIRAMVKFCPVCGTPWKANLYICANTDCGVKLRVEPKALNWWMFYPPCNGWARLKES